MCEIELVDRQCQDLPAGTPVMDPEAVEQLLQRVDGWQVGEGGTSIRRTYVFADFSSAIHFVNRVADLAESEQHHPDIRIHAYRRVRLEFSTFSIRGLSENDFIMAAKTNRVLAGPF